MSSARERARCFVALALGAELGARVAAEVERVLAPAEFRRPEGAGLHLTLAFLGEVERERLRGLTAALGPALVHFPAPQLRLTRGGAFPGLSRSRVLWIGVAERAASGRLAACRAAVLAGLAEAGFSGMGEEHAAFTPHVSVARPRDPRAPVPAAFAALELWLDWDPDAVALFESRLGPAGSRYEVVARFPFSGHT